MQLFTGPTPDYHRPSDTAQTIDAEGLVVVTEAAHEAIGYLAERTDPMTVSIPSASQTEAPPQSSSAERRASLGTMPDFAFEGPGVRVHQVMPGSAAEKAGIQVGDVLVALDGDEISDLRTYSGLLKSHDPGDRVEVTVERDGERRSMTAVLGAR